MLYETIESQENIQLEKARQDDVSDPESLELELGFEQVFYFFEFFRRASGLTPMEFRRRSGKL